MLRFIDKKNRTCCNFTFITDPNTPDYLGWFL